MSAPVSTLNAIQAMGVYDGLGDIYLAKMTDKGNASTPPTWETPILACEGVQISLQPQYAEGSQSASNRVIRKQKRLTSLSVTVQYPRMLPEVMAYIHGRSLDANGGETVGDNISPEFAMGIKATRDDGTVVMRWLYMGTLTEGNLDHATREDGTITYQIPTLEGSFLPISYEHTEGGVKVHPVQYKLDTENSGAAWTEDTFFAAVVGPWASGANVLTGLAVDTTTGDTVLGAAVSSLQSSISVGINAITGTLLYKTGFTGYSDVAAEQSGNYLALHITSTDATAIKFELLGGTEGEQTVPAGGVICCRVTNKATQQLKITATKDGYVPQTVTYSLAGLTCNAS